MPIPDAQAGPIDPADTDSGIPKELWPNVFEDRNREMRETIKWMEENEDKWVPKPK